MQFTDLGTQLAHIGNEAMLSGMTTTETARHLHAFAQLQRGATVEDAVNIATGATNDVPVRRHGGVTYQGIKEMKAFCVEHGIEFPAKQSRRANWQDAIHNAGYVIA